MGGEIRDYRQISSVVLFEADLDVRVRFLLSYDLTGGADSIATGRSESSVCGQHRRVGQEPTQRQRISRNKRTKLASQMIISVFFPPDQRCSPWPSPAQAPPPWWHSDHVSHPPPDCRGPSPSTPARAAACWGCLSRKRHRQIKWSLSVYLYSTGGAICICHSPWRRIPKVSPCAKSITLHQVGRPQPYSRCHQLPI
jgi:hypothetical protein